MVDQKTIVQVNEAARGARGLPGTSDHALRPESYGAVRDDPTFDNSAAFAAASAALAAQGGGTIELYPGSTYWVGNNEGAGVAGYFFPPTVQYLLDFDGLAKQVVLRMNGAQIKCQPGLRFGVFNADATVHPTVQPFYGAPGTGIAVPYFAMIRARACTGGVVIENGELNGDINSAIIGGAYGDTGWQIPMSGIILDSNLCAVVIDRVRSHHHGQDGIMRIHAGVVEGDPSYPVIMRDCAFKMNGRQGFSWVGGKGVYALRCQFNDTGKNGVVASAPGAGVDIEAEASICRDGRFEDCEYVNNFGVGELHVGDVAHIEHENCTFIGTTSWSLWPASPFCRFNNCTIIGAGVQQYGHADEKKANQFINCRFLAGTNHHPAGVYLPAGSGLMWDAGASSDVNVLHDNCLFDTENNAVAVLPWYANLGALWRDCVFRQRISVTGSFVRGKFFGRNLIDSTGFNDLYTSVNYGDLTQTGAAPFTATRTIPELTTVQGNLTIAPLLNNAELTLTPAGASVYSILNLQGTGANLARGLQLIAGEYNAYLSADTITLRSAANDVYVTAAAGQISLSRHSIRLGRSDNPVAADTSVFLLNTNVRNFLNFQSNLGGGLVTDAIISSFRGLGLFFDAYGDRHRFSLNDVIIAEIKADGLHVSGANSDFTGSLTVLGATSGLFINSRDTGTAFQLYNSAGVLGFHNGANRMTLGPTGDVMIAGNLTAPNVVLKNPVTNAQVITRGAAVGTALVVSATADPVGSPNGVAHVSIGHDGDAKPGYLAFHDVTGSGYVGWRNGHNRFDISGDQAFEFNLAPFVGTNVVYHAGNLTSGVITTALSANSIVLSKLVAATGAGFIAASVAGNFAETSPASARSILGLTYFATGTDAANLTGTIPAGVTAALTGDVTKSAGSNATTIAANAVTFSKFVAATAAGIVGATAAGNFAQLTAAQAKSVLAIASGDVSGLGVFATGTNAANLTGTLGAAQMPALTGDVTSSAGAVTTTIATNAVTFSKFIAATGAGVVGATAAGNFQQLTTTQLTTLINAATSGLSGAMSAQDKTRLDAHATFYRTVIDSSASATAALAAATYLMGQGQALVPAAGSGIPPNILFIAAADYPAIGTLTAKLRVRANVQCNDVAPGMNFTIGLYPLTRPATSGSAGVLIYTVGAAIASVAFNAPAADSQNTNVTADFALPADGYYALGVVTSGALAASSHVHLNAVLQMHYT